MQFPGLTCIHGIHPNDRFPAKDHTGDIIRSPSPLPSPAMEVEDETTFPMVMHPKTMSRAEKEKVRRIVTPKQQTGRLEVPKEICDMWHDSKGRDKLLQMWCKSGGIKARQVFVHLDRCDVSPYKSKNPFSYVDLDPYLGQAVFVERVEILSVATKTKTLEVKGGFYSEEDMKTELGYSQNIGFNIDRYNIHTMHVYKALKMFLPCMAHACAFQLRDRIDKIVKWATSKDLVRFLGFINKSHMQFTMSLLVPGCVSTMTLSASTGSTHEQRDLSNERTWSG